MRITFFSGWGLKSGLGAVLCLPLGVVFIFFGFQTVHLDMKRTAPGVISGTLKREHFWGLYSSNYALDKVAGAKVERSHGKNSKGHSSSSAVISCASSEVPVFFGSSNVDALEKRSIVDRINAYVSDQSAATLQETVRIRNVFGWLGLALFPLSLAGIAWWSFSMIRNLRNGFVDI